MTFLVYLAGPITGVSYGDSTDWRQEVIDSLPNDIKGLSPLRGKDYLKNETNLQHTYDWPLSTQRGIYARDRYDCTRSDAILVNLLGAEKVSIGTVMEIAWAADNSIPVILMMEKEGNVHDHPMIREACPFVVDNLQEAVTVLTALLLPSSH